MRIDAMKVRELSKGNYGWVVWIVDGNKRIELGKVSAKTVSAAKAKGRALARKKFKG